MLAAGTRLGPYEILAPLGAGGMGEVWKAKDTKLDRLVAVKVLPAAFADQADLLARFEREAKAVAALSHPGILGIFDFGKAEGITFAAMELLEGESLRDRLRAGALLPKKAQELAAQIAEALAAAHGRGIIHRDLKPENLWITLEGRIKVLDFGLAKQVPLLQKGRQSETPTQAFGAGSEPGTILGTVGYMSPEQVRGEPADARSDVFSFGIVLYEMLSGQAPFHGETPVQTMSAILEKEPPELTAAKGMLPPALERIVMHCLEKRAEARFQSARDLAFALQAPSGGQEPVSARPGTRPRAPWRAGLALGSAGLAALAGMAFWILHPTSSHPEVKYTSVSPWGAVATDARFLSGGDSVLTSWSPAPWQEPGTYLAKLDRAENRLRISDPPASLAGVSRSDEIGVLLAPAFLNGWPHYFRGRLALGRAGQSEPRTVMEDVAGVDWTADGATMAVLRCLRPRGMAVECPPGNVLATTEGWFSSLRFSPDGKRLAWALHPEPGDDGGVLQVLERDGGHVPKRLGRSWGRINGLAWHPLTGELWVGGADVHSGEIAAFDRNGRQRTIATYPYITFLYDIDAKGRVLMGQGSMSVACGLVASDGKATRMGGSFTQLMAASRDGRRFLVCDVTSWADFTMEVHLMQRGRDLPIVLGRSTADFAAFSADDALVGILVKGESGPALRLLPVAGGAPKDLPLAPLVDIRRFAWDRLGRIWVLGKPAGGSLALYQVEPGRSPQPLDTPLPGGTLDFGIPPGRTDAIVAVLDQNLLQVPLDGGPATPLGLSLSKLGYSVFPMENGERFMGWDESGGGIYLSKDHRPPVRVERVALADGRRSPYCSFQSSEATWAAPYVALDGGKSLLAVWPRFGMQVFMAEGLR